MPAIIVVSMSASTQRTGLSSGSAAARSKFTTVPAGRRRFAEHENVAGDGGAGASQQLLGDRSGGHTRGCFPRARALENVAHVGPTVLGDAGQIGVPRARTCNGGSGARRRPQPPVGRCSHPCRRRPASCTASSASRDSRSSSRSGRRSFRRRVRRRASRAVRLDRHAATAAVAALPAAQVTRDRLECRGRGPPGCLRESPRARAHATRRQ